MQSKTQLSSLLANGETANQESLTTPKHIDRQKSASSIAPSLGHSDVKVFPQPSIHSLAAEEVAGFEKPKQETNEQEGRTADQIEGNIGQPDP